MFLDDERHYSLLDKAIAHFDHALRTIAGKPLTTDRPHPAEDTPEAELSVTEKKHVAGLMRVNHAGEVSAQGLYQGQSLTARDANIRQNMAESAKEENDHLAWCENRLHELGSHKSVLAPVWYTGSLLIGMIAGLAGDKWSLGFVEETEQQVTNHLENHETRLPDQDQKTAKIIAQMKLDEAEHAAKANQAGAEELPYAIKSLMQAVSKVMTSTAYYI